MSVETQPGLPVVVTIPPARPAPAPAVNGKAKSRATTGRRVRVAAVVPCYNRAKDIENLLADFARLDTRGVALWIVVVDNASAVPLSTVKAPDGLRVEHLRLESNTGGAGGFNAGMARVLSGEGLSARFDPPDFIWILDSDVRLSRRALRELIKAHRSRDDLAAVGSALVDPVTREVYEIGGKLKRGSGSYRPAAKGSVDHRFLVKCQYLAACSVLVRREAVEKTGLMPDIFINGDDVEWFLRMGQATGLKMMGAPRSVVYHPFGVRRFQTWVRYYVTRNAYAPIDALRLGALARFRHALLDTARAVSQTMMGFPELAALHLQGLADAAAGRTAGHGPAGGIAPIAQATKLTPFTDLAVAVRAELARPGSRGRIYVHPLMLSRVGEFSELERQLALLGVRVDADPSWEERGLDTHRVSDTVKALFRGLFAPGADVAIVPTGWPTSWFRGRTMVQITNDGFLVRSVGRVECIRRGFAVFAKGLGLAFKVACRTPHVNTLPAAPVRRTPRPQG